jgi:hypothetical protein
MAGEDEFPDERTAVDPVVELAKDSPTRQRFTLACQFCGNEHIPGRDPRGPCEHCGCVPAAAKHACLGCEGPVLWLPALAQFPRPKTFAEAIKIAQGRCVACPTYWACPVAPGSWSR